MGPTPERSEGARLNCINIYSKLQEVICLSPPSQLQA
jgi:hypothetical protein